MAQTTAAVPTEDTDQLDSTDVHTPLVSNSSAGGGIKTNTDSSDVPVSTNGGGVHTREARRVRISLDLTRPPLDKEATYNLYQVQVMSALFYMVSAVCLVLLNKAIITTFPYTFTVVILQCSVTITLDAFIIGYLAYSRHRAPEFLSFSQFLQFLPIAFFFVCILVTGMEVLKYVSVFTLVALRYLSCLTSYAGEIIFLGRRFQWEVIPSLAIIIAGGFIYWVNDIEFSVVGYLLVAFNVIAHSGFALYSKWVDVHRHYSIFTMSIYNNAISLCILGVCAFLSYEFPDRAVHALHSLSWAGHIYLWFSCLAGWSISISGFLANQVFSPTAWTLQMSLDKVPTMLLSVIFFNIQISTGIITGAAISLVGGLAYPLTNIYLDQKRGYQQVATEEPPHMTNTEIEKETIPDAPTAEKTT